MCLWRYINIIFYYYYYLLLFTFDSGEYNRPTENNFLRSHAFIHFRNRLNVTSDLLGGTAEPCLHTPRRNTKGSCPIATRSHVYGRIDLHNNKDTLTNKVRSVNRSVDKIVTRVSSASNGAWRRIHEQTPRGESAPSRASVASAKQRSTVRSNSVRPDWNFY